MGQADIWMPLWVNDFVGGTTILDAEGTGCYLLLLMHSWQNGPIPKDKKKAMRISRLYHGDQGVILDEILSEYWELTPTGYISPRLEKERLKAIENKDRLSVRGKKAATARWGTTSNAQAMHKVCPPPPPPPSPSYPQSEEKRESAKRFTPPTLEEVKEYGREYSGTRFADAERFIDFYASKGWLVGKAKMKDWKAAVRNWTRKDSSPSDDKEIETAQRKREDERQALAAAKAGVEIPSVMGAILKAKKGEAA